MKPYWLRYYEENDGGGNDLGGGDPAPVDPATIEPEPAPAAKAEPDPVSSVPADWPGDWRNKFSPDGKHAKTLDRFASPNAVFESYMSLKQKVDSGELKSNTPFPKEGAPEDQLAWRKAHGIPESAADYEAHFSDGLVFGDEDKPVVDEFLQLAHKNNSSPEMVKDTLDWYYGFQEKRMDQQQEADAQYRTAAEDTLRAEWGGEYRTNINVIKGFVDTMPESVRDLFLEARLGDGNALVNNPDMARWLVHNAKIVNPVATVVPNAGANVATAIEDEIAAIEKVMVTNRKAYNDDVKMQERLRTLYGARERASS